MNKNSFAEVVHARLVESGSVLELLSRHEAVVLERLRHGGGATNWYYCAGKNRLSDIERVLSPGSVVSFYFDDRIARVGFSPQLKTRLESIIADTGDVVIGRLKKNGLSLDVEFVDNPLELAEVLSTMGAGEELFYGAFPARDNDGVYAITMVLPDEDGVVRSHPH